MRKLHITLLAATLLGVFTTQSFAGNRAVEGLAIGGASGAIAGQVVGRNVESTILGATIGGVLGAVLGSEMNQHHLYGPPPPPVVYHYPGPPPPPIHYTVQQPKPRYLQRCRETVRIRDGHHRSRTVVSTVCYNDHSGYPHHSNRHEHFAHDYRWQPPHHPRF